jgi:hypothetical protein
MVREDAVYETGAATLYEMARDDTREEFAERYFYTVTSDDFADIEPDEPARNAIGRWNEEQRKAATAAAQPLAFPMAPHGFDATDRSLRRRSTNFGNAIADAVRIATDADVALINAGSFRADDVLGAIDAQSLREVFLHDVPTGVTVTELTAQELEACYRHAQTRGGLGGFLQVSDTLERILSSGRSRFTVAIVTFLLTHSQDGYQRLLADSRGCPPEHVLDHVGVLPRKQASLISLVIDGTNRESILYSDEIRLSALQGTRERDDELLDRFIVLIDAYLAECRLATLDRQASRFFLEDDDECLRDIRFNTEGRSIEPATVQKHWPELQDHRRQIDALMVEMWRHCGRLRELRRLHKNLKLRREPFERQVPYPDYFDNANDRLGVRINDALVRQRDLKRRAARPGGDDKSTT